MAGYVRLRTAQWLVEHLPLAQARAIADALADAQWRRSCRDRRVVQRNLELVLDRPVSERSPLVRGVFRAFGAYMVEFFSMHDRPPPLRAVEGREHLATATAGNRGAILLGAHVGNWELGAVMVRRLGYRMASVALPHSAPRTDALFNAQRRRCGVEVIPLGVEAARACLMWLQSGGLVGLLGDRVLVRHGQPCRWFERQAILPTGPVVLSLRTGAAIVPTCAARTPDGGFRLTFHEPIWPEVARGSHAVSRLLQRCAVALEADIRSAPGQWLMFHPVHVVDEAGDPAFAGVVAQSRAGRRDAVGMVAAPATMSGRPRPAR